MKTVLQHPHRWNIWFDLYAIVVGSLMYVMVCTIMDISHAVGVLRIYMPKLGKEHGTPIKRVFIYLHGTTYYANYY